MSDTGLSTYRQRRNIACPDRLVTIARGGAELTQDRPALDSDDVVILLDVDNTLLDNDGLKREAASRIASLVGSDGADRFWEIYEEVRRDEEVVDFPETVRRWAHEIGDSGAGEQLLTVLEQLPFDEYLYPQVMETIDYLGTIGTPMILSDGDMVFQPLKIRESGLEAAVGGRVLVCVHKELELPALFVQYPARHYVMIDDKPRILSALEQECPTTFTTVLVMQGKYAVKGEFEPEPDYIVQAFGDMRNFSGAQLLVS